jgi:hypothetical protein
MPPIHKRVALFYFNDGILISIHTGRWCVVLLTLSLRLEDLFQQNCAPFRHSTFSLQIQPDPAPQLATRCSTFHRSSSVAVDLRVSNVVDVPNYVVSALIPEAIFES